MSKRKASSSLIKNNCLPGEGKKCLITGITGQDGSYLTDFLLKKGYEVHGIIRRSSSFNTGRIDYLYTNPKLFLHFGDLSDATCLTHVISEVKPNEIYNLGAQSHVKVSFEMSEYTSDIDGIGTLRLINCVRAAELQDFTRIYHASTSELYGKVIETPQKETTPFYPRSPYAVAKQFAYWILVNYREAYNMYLVNGILFNHESPRRGPTFVTRKITRAVARIKIGEQEYVSLGNIDAKRDWGHARDYVEAMWLMLQQPFPDDYVVATGECHSVREFIEEAFKCIGKTIIWKGKRGSLEEIGVDNEGVTRVRIDPKYFRPTEVDILIGDYSKAKKKLGWAPKITFKQLVEEMVTADLDTVTDKTLKW